MKNIYTKSVLIKKVSLFFSVIVFAIAVNAQPVLTSAPSAPMGTKMYGYNVTGTFAHTAAGAAQSWDYSTVAHDPTTFYFQEVPYSGLSQQIKDTFPDGNNASEYILGGSKVATIVGKFVNTYQATLGLAFTSSFQKYAVPDTFLIIPMNYQDAFDKREYDAYGTLKTPFGSYNNVIRIKENLAADNKFRYLYFQFEPVYRVLMEYKVEKTTQAIDGKQFYNLDYTPNSIEQFADKSAFQIYPNPSASEINVMLPGTENVSVTMVNTLGEVVFEENNVSAKVQKIDVSAFANGIYFLNLNGKTFDQTNRVIVQH